MLVTALFFGGTAWSQELGERPDQKATQQEAPEEAPLPITKAPTVLEFVEADFPEGAKLQGLEGTVGLAIEIDAAGVVGHIEVMQPAGHGFDEAAIAAVERMKFTPAETREGPIPVAIEFEYNFVLDEDEKAASLKPINLEGHVRQMGSRADVDGATIVAKSKTAEFEAITDAEGEFSFRGLPVGVIWLEARAPGLETTKKTLKIVEGEVTDIALWMKQTYTADEQMVVIGERPEPDISRRTISVDEIRKIPGTFGDPVRVIQNLPGTARAPFGSGLVVVRGSNPEATAYYVDGIRVPLIYHLGGLVSIVNDDLVGSVDYLPGGYGVEYGRSTGGVININTSQKYPEKFRVETSVDLLDAGAVIQGRTGKDDRWGLTAAGRRSYIDVFIPIFTQNSGFTVKPYWWDYQAKIDDLNKDNGRFTILVMGFGDKLFFGSPDDVEQGTDQDQQGDADVRYGSHRVIAQYTQEFSPELTERFTPSFGIDYIAFGLGNDWKFENKAWLTEIRGDLLWNPIPALTLRPGVDLIGGPYEVTIELPYSPESFANTDPLAEREDYATSFEGSVWAADPFLEAWIKPIEGSDKLIITPGLRLNTLFFPDYWETSLDPRLSFRYSPLESTTLKAGTGIYHQPPQGPDLGFNADDIQVDFERNWGSEIGIEQSFGPAIEAEVTTFYKKLDDLIIENEELETDDDPFFVNGGQGRVVGMEMMLRHNPVGSFFGWISYTLSKAERYQVPTQGEESVAGSNEDEWRPFEYDQTHILVALAGFELPKDWGISGRFRYTTGNPYTPYDAGIYDIDQDAYTPYSTGAPLSDRLPPFTALDMRVDKLYTFKRWWLETYVDLLNVVRGQNPEAVQYNYDYTEEAYVRGLPFLPSVGFRAEFEL